MWKSGEVFLFLFTFIFFNALVCMSEDSDLDVILDGFEEETISLGDLSESSKKIIPEYLSGHIKLSSSYAFSHDKPEKDNPDHRGISKFTPEILLEYEKSFSNALKLFTSGKAYYDFAYAFKGRGDYPGKLLDEYEADIELKDTYLEFSPVENLDIRIGKQIAVWGKSDNLRITDVINPMDNREVGITDIEDLRLPQAMTKIDYMKDRWIITGLVIHQVELNKNPVYGSDFYGSLSDLNVEEMESDLSNTQFGLAFQGFFTGWDLSFYFADIYSREGYFSANDLQVEHSRIKMAGTAFAGAFGDYLLKAEAAFIHGLEYTSTEEKARLDLMAGFEYMGVTDTTISFEIVNRHIFDFEEIMENMPDDQKENRLETALRFDRDFFNETLKFTGLVIIYGEFGEEGAISRGSLEYDIDDSLSIKSGVVFYESGDLKKMENIGKNDRLFCELKYAF